MTAAGVGTRPQPSGLPMTDGRQIGEGTGTPKTSTLATTLAYERDWAAFRAWCRKQERPALPASPDDVAAYLATLVSTRPRSRGTLDRCLAAIGRAHRAAGHPWVTAHPAIRAVLRAAPRGTRARRLTPGQLERLLRACGSNLAGLRDRALLLLHLAAGLRRGELVCLAAEHVRFTPAGVRLVLAMSLENRKDDEEASST